MKSFDKGKKVNVNYTIDENIYRQFKIAAEKDGRKMSQVVNQAIIKYVEKVNEGHTEKLF